MATIEDVNERTILQQFHSLYKKQNETETNVQNLDVKIDKEKTERQTADLSLNTEIQTLKDQIDSLGVLFTYKGEVAIIQDLPATNNKPGDVYYVDSEQSEYVWLEKSGVYQWEEFGPAIDLSEYAKQEDLGQLENAVNAMNTKVESNTSNIVSLTNTKQDKLTAGTNITIDENNVISASGGGGEKLYLHTVKFYDHSILINIYTKSSELFTIGSLTEWMYNHGFIDGKYFPTYNLTNWTYQPNPLKIKVINGIYAQSSSILKYSVEDVEFSIDNNKIITKDSIGSSDLSSIEYDRVAEI